MKRKIIQALLAVVIAIGLWMYVVMVVNPEWEDTFRDITVTLDNAEILNERGLMLVSDEIPKVTLRLSGNRADMIKLNSSNITLRADLSRIYSAGEQTLEYSISYPPDVSSNAFEIISQTPHQITLSVAEWKSAEIEVEPIFSGEVPPQYMFFRDIAPQKITVTGPVEVIDRIAMAKVDINLDGRTETSNEKFDYVLCDANGAPVESKWVKRSVEQVSYTLKIQRWKDIEVRVDVIDGGGLKKEDCTINQSVSTIRVSGSEKQLEDLDYLVVGEIDLAQVLKNEIKTYNIIMPEGITNHSGKNAVEVSLVIPELSTKWLAVSDIGYVNLSPGMTAEINTTEQDIQVRGDGEFLKKLTPQDLRIQVDLTDAIVGTTSYKAVVIVVNNDYYDHVGAVGSYDILVTVSAQP